MRPSMTTAASSAIVTTQTIRWSFRMRAATAASRPTILMAPIRLPARQERGARSADMSAVRADEPRPELGQGARCDRGSGVAAGAEADAAEPNVGAGEPAVVRRTAVVGDELPAGG